MRRPARGSACASRPNKSASPAPRKPPGGGAKSADANRKRSGCSRRREPERLRAAQGLASQRRAWDLENGWRPRLEVSADEDRSRVREGNAVRLLAMFRRLAVSVYLEWRRRDMRRQRKSLRDFYDAMSLERPRRALALVSAARPSV